jgi:hypothetical protein
MSASRRTLGVPFIRAGARSTYPTATAAPGLQQARVAAARIAQGRLKPFTVTGVPAVAESF